MSGPRGPRGASHRSVLAACAPAGDQQASLAHVHARSPSREWLEGYLRAAQASFFQLSAAEMSNIIWALAKLGEWRARGLAFGLGCRVSAGVL